MNRIIVFIILFFFSWASFEPWKVAGAQKTSEQQSSTKSSPQKQNTQQPNNSSKKADSSLHDMKRIADKLNKKVKKGEISEQEFLSQITAIKQEASSFESEDADIRAKFNEIENKIQSANLPSEIMERHQKAVSDYDANYKKLKKYVDYIKQYKNTSQIANQSSISYEELKQNIEDMSAFLNENVKGKPHNPLDPHKLPHRPAEKVEPKVETMSKRDFEELNSEKEPILLAYNGDLENLQLAQTQTDLPTPEDTAENIEVQFTEGITSLAASLDNHPLNIFKWVRQNIRFIPTFGSIQGAESCRLSRECNAHDAASLLIALLRVSDVPARYVTGTIQIDADLFKSALGDFEDIRAAARLAASGGLTVTLLNDPSSGEVAAVRMSHVWVEAFVDYVPSRGAVKGKGDTWVPLDGVIKRTNFKAPLDVVDALNLDVESIANNIINTGTVGPNEDSITGISETLAESELVSIRDNLNTYIETNLPDATVGDVIGAIEIEADALNVLPASLPAGVLPGKQNFSEIPASDRNRITVVVEGDFLLGSEEARVTRTTPELANKRITIGYVPDTQADADAIESFGGLLEVPPQLVNLKPVIYIEGEPVSIGSAIGMGEVQNIRVSFSDADGTNDSVVHQITAGSYAAVGLNSGIVRQESIEQRRQKLDSTTEIVGVENIDWDEVIGEILHLHAQAYFMETNALDQGASSQHNVVFYKRTTELLATYDFNISTLFGAPTDVSSTSMSVDLQRRVIGVSSRVGNEDQERSFIYLTGNTGSAAEHGVFQKLQEAEAVSATSLIALANNQGTPVFQINSSNINEVLPQLSIDSEVVNEIINAVAAGKEVFTPQQNISFLDYTGLGYIIFDKETGAGAFLISGGLAGGETAGASGFLNFINEIIPLLSALADVGSPSFRYVLDRLKVEAFDPNYVSRVGIFLLILSAIATGFDTFHDTGDVSSAILAASFDLLLGAIANFLIGQAIGIGLAAFGIAISPVVLMVIALITAVLFALTFAIIQGIVAAFRFINPNLKSIFYVKKEEIDLKNINSCDSIVFGVVVS